MNTCSLKPRIVWLFGICFAVMLLVSCNGKNTKVTKVNYDKINSGMSLVEVEAILGKGVDSNKNEPLQITGGYLMGETFKKWEEGSSIIILGFKEDKVVGKAMVGPD